MEAQQLYVYDIYFLCPCEGRLWTEEKITEVKKDLFNIYPSKHILYSIKANLSTQNCFKHFKKYLEPATFKAEGMC